MIQIQARYALVASLFLLTAVGCSSTGNGPAGPAATATASQTSPSAGSASASGSGTAVGAPRVTIKDFTFGPDQPHVRPGESITVVNDDTTAHTLTAADKSFDTGTIAPGASATVTAPAQPGTYPFICSIHTYMNGTLTVS